MRELNNFYKWTALSLRKTQLSVDQKVVFCQITDSYKYMAARSIVLAEWNWTGHHPTFFAYFVVALEELGVNILAICPRTGDARQIVAKIREDRDLVISCESQTIYREIKTFQRRNYTQMFSWLGQIEWSLQHFRSIEQLAKMWQAESGNEESLIFYACMFDRDFDCFQTIQPFLSLPWAGLYLHATVNRKHSVKFPRRVPKPLTMTRSSLCRAIAILDEGIVAQFKENTGKPVVVLPEVTDERLPTHLDRCLLTDELLRFADGRPVVGIFGYLMKSKGILELASISRNPQMSAICFVFAGEIPWENFSPQETQILTNAFTHGKNTWTHLMRIPQEQHLNSLMSACDILFAAYLDFPSSSNIMTKAALVRKPLIVSDGHLMAERVRRFKMGEIVPEGDIQAQMAAILKITQNRKAWLSENQPRWTDYLHEHSFERLKGAFRDLLSAT